MKLYKVTIGLFLMLSSISFLKAQSYKVSETMTVIDGKYTNAMMVNLPSEADDMEEEWEDYLEDNYDLELDKVGRKRDTTTYISEKVIKDNLNNVSYDIYSKIVDNENGTTDLYVKWAFNEETFIETIDNPQKAADAKYMMERFAKRAYIKFYEEQLEDLVDKQEDAIDDYDDLNDDVEKLEKRNKKLERKINKYKADIDSNKEQKEANRTEMEALEKVSNSLKKQIDTIQFELKNVKK